MNERSTIARRGARVLPTWMELGELLRLALPVVVVQVGLFAMGVVDSIVVGHVSANALASVALGNLYFFGLSVFGMGVLMALDPVVAQAVGAGDGVTIARAVQCGLVLALALSVPTGLLLLTAEPVLTWMGQPAAIVPDAALYARLLVPGVAPFLGFIVLRQTLQAMGRMRPIVWIIVISNVVNAALDWVLVYGALGVPALGVAGAAWATTASRWLLGLGLLAFGWSDLRHRLWPIRPELREWRPLARMGALGVPIGLQYLLEWGGFGTVGILMGRLGTVPVAAHQVAINLASLTFMVPLGISAAAAVLVGQAVGRADLPAARRAARAAIVCAAAFMAATALAMIALPTPLARVYANDLAVVALASTLLPVAGTFQIFDGMQVVAIGILRGVADTRTPFVTALLGFWLIGFPVSLILGFATPLGPVGLWWGLVVGLATVAVLLLLRVRAQLRRAISRIVIDEPVAA